MTAETATILGAVIGAFLAAGAGWFLNWQIEASRHKKLRTLYLTAILDDLHHSKALYDKIDEEWKKSKTVWFSTTIEFKESRNIYNKHRDHVLLINNDKIRQRLFKYYLKSGELVNQLEFSQNRKMELTKSFNAMIRDFMVRDKSTYDNARANAAKIMTEEIEEYTKINNDITGLVLELHKYKLEAEELIKAIKV